MANEPFSPERLKEAMCGMSNIDLAEKLGCSRSVISMYLSGDRTPGKMTVKLMAICLGVSPAWLIGMDVPKYVKAPSTVSDEGIADDEQKLIDNYRFLNAEGQEKATDYLDDLVQSGKYKKHNPAVMDKNA